MPPPSAIALIRASLITALFLPALALSQEPSTAVAQTASTAEKGESAIATAKAIQGLSLWDPNSKLLGEVDDVILDRETSQLRMIVISLGGILGIGGKDIAIDWTEIDYNPQARLLRTRNLTAEDLESQTPFDPDSNGVSIKNGP